MPEFSRRNAALALAAGFIILFVGGGARFAIGLTLRPMVDEFHWGRSVLGSAVALFQFVSAVCMFLAGRLADRASLRLLMGTGALISAFGLALMSQLSAPWHALVLYGVFFAIGNGVASTTAVGVMITRAYPARAGLANGVVTSGMSVGQLVMIAVLTAVLAGIGWREVYVWLGLAHLLLIPLILYAVPGATSPAHASATPMREGMSLREAARTAPFWALLVIYGICGLDDFFVSTHVVAFAQDRGLDAMLAGNLLALMGLTGLIGVLAAGVAGDWAGPAWATAASFVARAAVFALILVDRSPLSVAIFALVFGLTFLVTAPLTVLFVRDLFGMRHLGAIAGMITMVHHICGGFGAYLGAAVFDATRTYTIAFIVMLVASLIALAMTFVLQRLRMPVAA
jgi:predicted MFS family arabinose efflux permease